MKLSTTFITSFLLLAAEQAFATTDANGQEKDRVVSCCGAPAQGPDGAPRGWCESIGGHMGCCTDRLLGVFGEFPCRVYIYVPNRHFSGREGLRYDGASAFTEARPKQTAA
ncbi:hypothetical protein PTNB85_02438 [Pyrenophora teres f. teres]|nr:hypothetical protein HRS9139_01021 [Pyrenophora teres f. teres]KAE8848595.1 hypothetical protein PTNB85_02438 [Pyrenophora teres f. teres]KAE8868521.1 hypothetical protein PTNB29_02432 [Pyrenophora teres f. teres]